MQYDPKLKIAMQEIKEILDKHDIGASVVIHSPGFSEFLLKIDPGYSCAKIEGDGVRIRAKKEEYGGDSVKRDKALNDTINMIDHLSTTSGKTAMMLFGVMDEVKKHVDVDSTEGGMTSHTTQNN